MGDNIRFTFLGTGNAFGNSGRRRSHYFLEASINILIDAGYDALPGLRSINRSILDVDLICLSHLHPDHYMAIPQFALENYYVTKKAEPIPILGPIDMKSTIKQATNALFDDEITEHLEELFRFYEVGPNKRIEFKDIAELHSDNGYLETLEASHSGNGRMQIVSIDGVSVGYTGDSAFVDRSFEKLRICNIVISEASSVDTEIPGHTTLNTLLAQNYDQSPPIYLSHLGDPVIKKKDELELPFIVAYDGLQIEL